MMENDEIFMLKALELAKEAASEDEVPVGAVIVRDGEIIGYGRNRRDKGKHALAHAEIEAIDMACKALGGWRLPRCTIYITLEPCPMCCGALVNSRIERAVIAAHDAKTGALGSVLNFNSYPLNHKIKAEYGLFRKEAESLMSEFFAKIRAKRK
jgi:tRNA(adenine34) deaminase